MMSSKQSRNYRTQRNLIVRILAIYQNAIHFKLTHDDIAEQMNEKVFNSKEAKTLPRHMIEFLHGYYEAKREEMYKHHIHWMLYCDGKLMTSKEVHELAQKEVFLAKNKNLQIDTKSSGDEYISPWGRIKGDLCRHVWADANNVPILNKPYDRKFLGC